MSAQLTALETACRCFAGDELPYAEQVRRCHQVEARLVPEDEFAAVHARLDDALPGKGALPERYRAWRETQLVAPALIRPGLEALAAELRERTAALVELPDDEVEFELVTDVPWSGFADYLGNLRTRVSINVDLPMPSTQLFELVTHEVYPGHHTDHVCKEPLLVEQARTELAIYLYPDSAGGRGRGHRDDRAGSRSSVRTPSRSPPRSCVRSGLPTTPTRRPSSVPPTTPSTGSGSNVVQLVAEGGLARDEARPYLRRWLIDPDEIIDKAATFYLDNPWPPYAVSYSAGQELARTFVAGDPARFRRLLGEQLTPEDLAA